LGANAEGPLQPEEEPKMEGPLQPGVAETKGETEKEGGENHPGQPRNTILVVDSQEDESMKVASVVESNKRKTPDDVPGSPAPRSPIASVYSAGPVRLIDPVSPRRDPNSGFDLNPVIAPTKTSMSYYSRKIGRMGEEAFTEFVENGGVQACIDISNEPNTKYRKFALSPVNASASPGSGSASGSGANGGAEEGEVDLTQSSQESGAS
jgi:hypothetical protein